MQSHANLNATSQRRDEVTVEGHTFPLYFCFEKRTSHDKSDVSYTRRLLLEKTFQTSLSLNSSVFSLLRNVDVWILTIAQVTRKAYFFAVGIFRFIFFVVFGQTYGWKVTWIIILLFINECHSAMCRQDWESDSRCLKTLRLHQTRYVFSIKSRLMLTTEYISAKETGSLSYITVDPPANKPSPSIWRTIIRRHRRQWLDRSVSWQSQITWMSARVCCLTSASPGRLLCVLAQTPLVRFVVDLL
jgi:hypothetical protein